MGSARDWLIDGAPGASTSQDVFAGTCERLLAAGVPLRRGEAYVRTLHPQLAGRAFAWERGVGNTVIEASYDAEMGIASAPVRHVLEHATQARYRPGVDPPMPGCDFALRGFTDVFAIPMRFISGENHACAFLSDAPGGFADEHIALIEGVMPPLSRIGEIFALRRTATNVLTAYVGRDAGARVLAGQIRRGDVELIEAAIWFSDMRGFSTISNQKNPREVLALLNELFDCQLPAIEKHGGEVLKFIGDGLLAIFTPRGGDLRECCERALTASREAVAAMHERNARPAVEPVKFGIALHVGEVAYGNIGGEGRLDFTCIGRAVNLAARIESLTGKTGNDILASDAFATRCRDNLVSIGSFEVKGFAEPVPAYRPV
ncbi:MAG TPA: adenylate/guanylate cyclase domain-containing protein [Kofleriaceae bacterium]|nr:adenylate/guanylate cyclase domain-containing protein [Kofleriaceae bacterium]